MSFKQEEKGEITTSTSTSTSTSTTEGELVRDFKEGSYKCDVCGNKAETLMVSNHTHNLEIGNKEMFTVGFKYGIVRKGYIIYACRKCAGPTCTTGPYTFCLFCSGQAKYCPKCQNFEEFDMPCDKFQTVALKCKRCEKIYVPKYSPVHEHYFS